MPPSEPRKRKKADEGLGLGYDLPVDRATGKKQKSEDEKARLKAVAQAAADLAKRQQADKDNRRKVEEGDLGDGKLHMAFIRVGLGDCIVVATPGGKVLLFDCGTLGPEGEKADPFAARVLSVLKNTKFLAGTNMIDVLVLSHPDTDHYNKLKPVLGTSFTLGACYHSGDWNDYATDRTKSWVEGQLSPKTNLWQVVLNHDTSILDVTKQGTVTLGGVPVPPGAGVNQLDPQRGIRIVIERDCLISIVAAGVSYEYHDDANIDGRNRGSIVTLIEAFGKKILICGDATINTEQFLMNTTGTRLENLTVLQVGHHGSFTTSSSQTWVDHTSPQIAIASAGKRIDKYHLPSKSVLDGYETVMTSAARAAVHEHETGCWVQNDGGNFSYTTIWPTQEVYTTGSYDTFHLTYPEAP